MTIRVFNNLKIPIVYRQRTLSIFQDTLQLSPSAMIPIYSLVNQGSVSCEQEEINQLKSMRNSGYTRVQVIDHVVVFEKSSPGPTSSYHDANGNLSLRTSSNKKEMMLSYVTCGITQYLDYEISHPANSRPDFGKDFSYRNVSTSNYYRSSGNLKPTANTMKTTITLTSDDLFHSSSGFPIYEKEYKEILATHNEYLVKNNPKNMYLPNDYYQKNNNKIYNAFALYSYTSTTANSYAAKIFGKQEFSNSDAHGHFTRHFSSIEAYRAAWIYATTKPKRTYLGNKINNDRHANHGAHMPIGLFDLLAFNFLEGYIDQMYQRPGSARSKTKKDINNKFIEKFFNKALHTSKRL